MEREEQLKFLKEGLEENGFEVETALCAGYRSQSQLHGQHNH